MKRARPILVATDFSSASRLALNEAVKLARERKAPLILVHVLIPPGPVSVDGMAFPRVYEEFEAQLRADATRRLQKTLREMKKARVEATAVLRKGVPESEIVRIGRSRGAAMIVMGTHGRRGFARFFLGSVASRVAASAHCPVLTVRSR